MYVPVGHTIKYIDVHGATRTLKCIERVEGLVNWRRGHPYSQAARYECEDGKILQVPDDAWALVNILDESVADCGKSQFLDPHTP